MANKNMKNISKLIVITGLAAMQTTFGADITGTITLKGTPPPEKDITPLKDDVNCGKLQATMPTTHFYVVGSKGELADVIVQLKNVTGKPAGASVPPLVLDQKGCLYSPQIFAVQTGQKISVKTSDPVPHNVHALPKAPGNNEFNRPQMAGDADLSLSFTKAENFVKFQCDVHQWMFAWATVVDSPYFAMSAKDGTFKIANVPAGKYTIEAAHRKAGVTTQEIEVKEGAATKADFTLEVK
jgi:plastocyanin